jgi:hypothetical protein
VNTYILERHILNLFAEKVKFVCVPRICLFVHRNLWEYTLVDDIFKILLDSLISSLCFQLGRREHTKYTKAHQRIILKAKNPA